jgi:hypothetical protein
MAPLPLLRELRCALGPTTINLIVGSKEAVLVSSDLFEAFHVWEEDQPATDSSEIDPSELN